MSEGFAGDALFEREPAQDERDQWTDLLSRGEDAAATERKSISVLIFSIGEELLALPTVELQEVMDLGPVHRVPHRDKHVLKGLVQIRGGLELCVSLGALLGSYPARGANPRASAGEKPQLLLVGRDGQRFAFPVSEVLSIHKISESELSDLSDSTLVRSSFSWRGSMVGLLQTDRLHQAMLDRISR